MKIIYSIARNEFRHLFYSPIAWFVLLVFLVQCAIFYTVPLLSTAGYQELMIQNSPDFKGFEDSLTMNLFLKTEFFRGIFRNLYLFIPILTMGLISREAIHNTNALLNSSPVSVRKIVLGKYLGIMLYNLLLVGIICAFLIAGCLSIKQADYGSLISALTGFYILVCAYSAIGLFMSSLSNYQIVSALATFTAIFVLSRIGELWQRYDFVRDLTYFLSLQNRTAKMLQGLLASKDLIYFIVVTAMFICFTILRIQNSRGGRAWHRRLAGYVTIMVVALAIGYTSSRPALTAYIDTTATKRNTIHQKTQKILAGFEKDSTLEVTLFTNLLGGGLVQGMPELRNVEYMDRFWERYIRFKPDIKFKYVLYYDNPLYNDSRFYRDHYGKDLKTIASEMAEALDADISMFRSPEEVARETKLGPESRQLVMQLKYKGRTAWLRTFNDPVFWPDETNMTAALKRVLEPSGPLVSYVTGELERSIVKTGEREYQGHSSAREVRNSLLNTGFDVDTVNLMTQDIPASTTALVLADPKMELRAPVLQKIQHYIAEGRNLMVTAEPEKQYILNPLLTELDVQLMNGQLVQPSYDETPDKVLSYITKTSAQLSEGLKWRNDLKPEDSPDVITPGAVALKISTGKGFKADTLTHTHLGRAWMKAGALVIDSILPPFNALEGDLKQSAFTTILKLTRNVKGKEQRVIVSGDADYASNTRFTRSRWNAAFFLPSYSWLVDNSFPVYTPMTPPKDILLTIGPKAAEVQKAVLVWVAPAALLIAGAVLLIRRKRK